jgi:hypothetical protein
MPGSDEVVGRYLRWLLAVLATACGLIHFAMAGEHFDISAVHGGFFAVTGWLQIAWAIALVIRPGDQRLLLAGALLNGGALAVWVLSRTVGVPVGPGAWTAEPVGFADALVAGFELVIVGALLLVALRPAVAERSVEPRAARLGVLGAALAVVVMSTTAVTPSFASDHHGGAGHGDDHAAYIVQADGSSKCEQAGVTNAGNSANGGHGHRGPVPWEPMDAATRHELAGQLAQAAAVARQFPTGADAVAAGYEPASIYVPCISSHYLWTDADTSVFDPSHPNILLFSGPEPDAELVGLSYTLVSETEPEGFAGPNDVWHAHTQLCMRPGFVLGTEDSTEEECEARGGQLVNTSTTWMTHLWNVPQWENRWGLFASEHPDLGGRMGDINGEPDPEADNRWFEEAPPATAG